MSQTKGSQPGLKLVATLSCKQNAVRAVRFNADGNYCLTSGGDKTIKLWNPHRDNCGLLLKTYSGHGYEVLDARSSHDNAQIASCGTDKQVLLWDVETGRILRKFRGHAGCVNSIAFNKESSVIVSGSLDGTVRAWDAKGRGQHPIQIMDEASDSVTSVSCSSHEILTGSADHHVRRYDLRQGMFYSDYLGKTVSCVNFSKDDQCILVSSLDSTVRLLEKGKGQMLAEFTGHANVDYKTDSSFFNSDRQVVSGSEDGKVYCWNLLGNEVLYTLKHPAPFVIASNLVGMSGWTTKVEFGQPDALRNRKIQVNGRVLYVCEFYLSIWSALFRRHFASETDRSTLLINKPYAAFIEFLQCIYPTQRKVNGDNLKLLLETASDFESEGMLAKCMGYMRRGCALSPMERLELADRYRLEPLLSELIVHFSTQRNLNLESTHYLNVSDHTKPKDPICNDRSTERFGLKSELNFTALRTQGSRVFYVNPYYVAAWSQLAFDTVVSMTTIESLSLAVSDDEAEAFLLAVYPPMEPCTDLNASVRLRAACSFRSPGLLCLTVDYVLNESANLNTGEKLLMLDRCKLHDVMPTCLLEVVNAHALIDLITRPAYDTFSSRAKACILDRLAFLLKHAQDIVV